MKKLAFVVALLLCTTSAYAFLPIGIENTIKSWFNSANKLVAMTIAGTLTADTIVSPDQDDALPNRTRLFRNTVDRTCAANGVANQLTLVDTLGTGNRWCLCDGTTEWVCFGAAVPNCTDGSGRHLNYTAATGAWSCGTS